MYVGKITRDFLDPPSPIGLWRVKGEGDKMEMVYSKKINRYENVVQGMIVGDFGPLRFEGGVDSETVIKNRKRYFDNFKIDLKDIVWQEQVHGDKIILVKVEDKGRLIKNNDGLICKESGIFLACLTADCVPISFYDPELLICGVAHSGWRGTLKNIAGKMIDRFIKIGSDVKDIIVYIGPAIGGCCYEISEAKDDRIKQFEALNKNFVQRKGKEIYLDLKKIVKKQILDKGVKLDNKEVSSICTCCDKRFSSYYRDGKVERDLVSVIGMRN